MAVIACSSQSHASQAKQSGSLNGLYTKGPRTLILYEYHSGYSIWVLKPIDLSPGPLG